MERPLPHRQGLRILSIGWDGPKGDYIAILNLMVKIRNGLGYNCTNEVNGVFDSGLDDAQLFKREFAC